VLTPLQVQRFETFGYLVLPQLLGDDIGWITEEFHAVFAESSLEHDGTKRTAIVPFVDQRERLAALVDHDAIEGVLGPLLGDDFTYCGSDGNFYSGDTGWHADGNHSIGKYLKIAIYLDPVDGDSGALRVIPGSHRAAALNGGWAARDAGRSVDLWGIEMRDVPSVTLRSEPGDVVVFNHNIMHASFGGSTARRMFTLNCVARVNTAAEVRELREYITVHRHFGLTRMHGPLMRDTGSPRRQRHLEQAIEHEDALLPDAMTQAQEPASQTQAM